MPVPKLYSSNRLELLAAALSEFLNPPLEDPFRPETVIVQSRGMERWLRMELARRHGVAANYRFPFPNAFLAELFAELLGPRPGEDPYGRDVLTWRIMGRLVSVGPGPGGEPLAAYLGHPPDPLRAYQLATRLADLLDQYQIYRPDWIRAWESQGGGWQGDLWRALLAETPGQHRLALRDRCLAHLEAAPGARAALPARVALFGLSSLPPHHLTFLAALAPYVETAFFVLNPCREYWFDIAKARRIEAATRNSGPGLPRLPEDLHLEEGHPLLAGLGDLGREFLAQLLEGECEERHIFADHADGHLLAQIQNALLNLETVPAPGARAVVADGDDSVQIHSCHGPFREMEILRDHILSWLESTPGLHPRDLVVMAPDIETYVPYILGVFGAVTPDDPRHIPFSIADRRLRSQSRVAAAFLSLLELETARLTAEEVLGFLEQGPVQARWELETADFVIIRRWVSQLRIRWGRDAAHRAELGLPPLEGNTWRFGLDRLLLGLAAPDEGRGRLFKGILPYDAVEGSEAQVLGRLADFLEALFDALDGLKLRRSLAEWSHFLCALLDRFFAPAESEVADLNRLRQDLLGLAAAEAGAGFHAGVDLTVIKAAVLQRLEDPDPGRGFLTGGITFCSLLPMRSIPFPVVCLVGMDGDAYPRPSHGLSFDQMRLAPRAGDRSRSKDDRYLFLEALLSARRRLYISYAGQDARDDARKPPSVLVGELLDYVEQAFRPPDDSPPAAGLRTRLVREHRLQAFSPAYFGDEEADPRFFSYSQTDAAGARALAAGPAEPTPFLPRPLEDPGPEWDRIDLDQVLDFFANPGRFLLRERLGVRLAEGDEGLEDHEPLLLEGLERYQMDQEVLGRRLRREDPAAWRETVRAAGALPAGRVGDWTYARVCRESEAFWERTLLPALGGRMPASRSLRLDLAGIALSARIAGTPEWAAVHWRYARLRARDHLAAWICHLAAGSDAPAGDARPSLLCGKGKKAGGRGDLFVFAPAEAPGELLADLLGIFRAGLRQPLPFFPAAALAYAEAVHARKDAAEALEKAKAVWQGTDFSRGEGQDPYYRICFRERDPFDREFAALAVAVFGPLLQHRSAGEARETQ